MSALEQIIGVSEDGDQQRQIVDYKMVTFTLGGTDYGIDIMSVKEIYKAEHLTPVPNTEPYVRGVFNLRGEIISVIDLRRMFNLPVPDLSAAEADDVIFVNVDDHLIGVVVDFINDVVGIDSSTIQPPHPLFGDINIKYISGVVEHDEKLFIILDTDAIFGIGSQEGPKTQQVSETPAPAVATGSTPTVSAEPLNFTFIAETLATFRSFYVSELNEDWVRTRFEEWERMRGSDSAAVQLKSDEDAGQFLQGFASAGADTFWSASTSDAIGKILVPSDGNVFSVWDVGCGQGHEALSIAALLKMKYPEKQIRVWAHDSDLLKVSNAPNMVYNLSELPEWIRGATQEGRNGIIFKKEITDSVSFEYHNVLHENKLPPVNLIIAKDVLSFFPTNGLAKVLADFLEMLVDGGMLIVGDNERIKDGNWTEREAPGIRWYAKTF